MTDSLTPETGTVQGSGLIEVPDLAKALAAFQRELPRIKAAEKVEVKTEKGRYDYSYADLASVSAIVLPLLAKQGLAFTAWPGINSRGQFVLRYMLMHSSGERIEGEYPIKGGNPQAVGSEITYARRYCLLAVSGVYPDDQDDDARAAVASAAAMTPPDPELEEARAKVRGAWQFHYGDLIVPELAQAYNRWSEGGDLWQAAPGELRRYAAYLSALPKEEAGSDPAAAASNQDALDPNPITPRQRGMLFALMGEIGLHDKGAQLTWINKQLGTEYESRTEITATNAKILIDGLQKGIDAPAQSEPAP